MARKAKPADANVRDQLTTQFVEELARDFAEHGKEIVETVRKESPSKYAELVLRLIPMQPVMVEAEDDKPNTSEDIGRKLLRDVGLTEPADRDIQAAIEAYDQFIANLQHLADQALH